MHDRKELQRRCLRARRFVARNDVYGDVLSGDIFRNETRAFRNEIVICGGGAAGARFVVHEGRKRT